MLIGNWRLALGMGSRLSDNHDNNNDDSIDKILLFYPAYIAYLLPIGCLLIGLGAHIFSHNEYGHGTRAQGQQCGGPGPGPHGRAWGPSSLRLGPWSRGQIRYG